MSIKAKKSPFAITAMVTSTVLSINIAQASDNPFQVIQLSSGYQIADNAEGKCGEGSCGEDKKSGEGKCGEGNCGEDKDKKSGEGKCGEGNCGGKK